LELGQYRPNSLEQAIITIKYESYIQKEHLQAARVGELENFVSQGRLDYKQMPALSHEAREKLLRVQPETIGQAARISGVSPADISVLMVYLGR
jgi:tRNA uridine 5-carboxymethylaminomethyl modification enzyme